MLTIGVPCIGGSVRVFRSLCQVKKPKMSVDNRVAFRHTFSPSILTISVPTRYNLQHMEPVSVFDELSSQLSGDDRRAMLAKIRSSFESAASPLMEEEDGSSTPPDVDQKVAALGLWRRLLLFVSQVFGGRDRGDVVTDWMVRDLERELDQAEREALDGRRRMFLDGFAGELEALRDAAASMRGPLTAFRSHRRELVVALAAESIPSVHREVLSLTDEQRIAGMNEDSEAYLKRQLTSALEKQLEAIPAAARVSLRRAVNQADTLVRLAELPFDDMLTSFDVTENGSRSASFESVTKPLTELYRALVSISQPIDLTLIEIVVLLADSSGHGQEDRPEELDEVLRRGMERILTALGAFRDLAARQPLLAILRVARSDPWWTTGPYEGGEDWIALYRSFAIERIQRQVLRVSLNSQLRKRLEDLSEACGGTLTALDVIPAGAADRAGSSRWYTGAALQSLVQVMWQQVMPSLRILLTSGEFYKASNRAQFNDAYSEIEQVPERLRLFAHDLRADEPWGRALAEAADPARWQQVVSRLDQEVDLIVDHVRTNLEMLTQVVGGVLYARPGSTFDTLANYGQIGGRRNAEYVDELKEVHRRLTQFNGTIGELQTIEKRAADTQLRLKSPVPSLTPTSGAGADAGAADDARDETRAEAAATGPDGSGSGSERADVEG